MSISDNFNWDEFQSIHQSTICNLIEEYAYEKLSYEKYERDLSNVIFLLKKYNEDINVDSLFDAYLIKRIFKEIWKIEFGKEINSKINGNFKNEHTFCLIPYDRYNLFKKDGTIRRIVMPCLDIYIKFIVYTIAVFDDFFLAIPKLCKNLNNVVLLNPLTNDVEFLEEGYASLKDTFTDGDVPSDISNQSMLMAIENEFCLYLDIENFFSSIYIHDIERLNNTCFFSSFKSNEKIKNYIDFLHTYNMRINNSETRGIITGPFSSHISSELLLLSIDFKLNSLINEEGFKIKYTRYVDDYKFYSDSLSQLETFEFKFQAILQEYNLKLNKSKRNISSCVDSIKINIKEVYEFEKIEIDSGDKDESGDIIYTVDYKKMSFYIYSCSEKLKENNYHYMQSWIEFIRDNCDYIYNQQKLFEIVTKFLISTVLQYPHHTRAIFKCYMILNKSEKFKDYTLEKEYKDSKLNLISLKYPNSLLELYYKAYFYSEINIVKFENNFSVINDNLKKGHIKEEYFKNNPFMSHIRNIQKKKKNIHTSNYHIWTED